MPEANAVVEAPALRTAEDSDKELAEIVARFHQNYSAKKSLHARTQSADHTTRPGLLAQVDALNEEDGELVKQMRFFFLEILGPRHAASLQRLNDSESAVLEQMQKADALRGAVDAARKEELRSWQQLKNLSRDCGMDVPGRPGNFRVGSGQQQTWGVTAPA